MTVSIAADDSGWDAIPDLAGLARRAVDAALAAAYEGPRPAVLAILFTGDAAIAEMNRRWRGKAKPTNVLSFPAPPGRPVPDGGPTLLGDIALAFGTVAREAAEQGKPLPHHATHLIVHGVLHLLGHDHEAEAGAEDMEALERKILKQLGIADPYERH
ncbi:MAG: rRNA maturation RNase YbeY [Hyphomicrobiales bacterium]